MDRQQRAVTHDMVGLSVAVQRSANVPSRLLLCETTPPCVETQNASSMLSGSAPPHSPPPPLRARAGLRSKQRNDCIILEESDELLALVRESPALPTEELCAGIPKVVVGCQVSRRSTTPTARRADRPVPCRGPASPSVVGRDADRGRSDSAGPWLQPGRWLARWRPTSDGGWASR